MTTTIKAPHPAHKVTTLLPNPEFGDSRASQSTLILKRTMTGRKITYAKPSDFYTLTLPFQLTRQKALELEALLNAYQSAPLHITLYDGSTWEARLVNEPVSRTATEKIATNNTRTGDELVEVTLTFSAKKLT